MRNIREIKEVEPKPEVNIFLRKPFISEDNNDNSQNKNQGFQEMLDDSMEQLKKEGKSFDDVAQTVLENKEEEHVLSSREVQILQLKSARKQYELIHNYRSQHEMNHSFDDENDGPKLH